MVLGFIPQHVATQLSRSLKLDKGLRICMICNTPAEPSNGMIQHSHNVHHICLKNHCPYAGAASINNQPWLDSSTLAWWGPSNSLLGILMAALKAMTLGSCSTVLTRCILLAVGAPGPSPAGAMANSIAVGVTIGFLALQLGTHSFHH